MERVGEEERLHFLKSIEKGGEVVIITHHNPDGDAVGSVTAMTQFLEERGIESTIIFPNQPPEYLQFLTEGKRSLIYNRESRAAQKRIEEAAIVIALDLNRLSRIDMMESSIRGAKGYKMVIDHHPSPEREEFDLVISHIDSSSTCELLYWFFLSLFKEGESLSLELATALYVGMMTDTNNFANSVSESTFIMASELLKLGVDKESLESRVFSSFREERMRLMGHLLANKMVVLKEHSAAYIVLTLEDKESFDYLDGDSEGFVNLPLKIEGINISALFTENEEEIRASFRSNNNFSVNRFSQRFFNGGGHERAAGGKIKIKVKRVGQYFLKSLDSFNNEE